MFAILYRPVVAQVISNVCPDFIPIWLCTMIRGIVNPSPVAAALFVVGVGLLILWSFRHEVTR